MKWYLKVFKQYVDFSGRARRTEYWMFQLFNYLIMFVIILFLGMLNLIENQFVIFSLVIYFFIGVFIPSLSVRVRRLHDINKSGWWVLISLVPYLGSIILLIFMLIEGTTGDNKYGPDPKVVEEFF